MKKEQRNAKNVKKEKGEHKKNRQKTQYQIERDAAKKKKKGGGNGLSI